MSDSEAVVEKRRGRPTKDKSEVIIFYMVNVNLFLFYMFNVKNYIHLIFHQDSVKEPKKRAREVEKKDKDVVKKDEDVPAKRGRGRPPKSGASGGKKTEKPKVCY